LTVSHRATAKYCTTATEPEINTPQWLRYWESLSASNFLALT
jgi:hypothetical protein